ncbi:MAG: hypothetical protein JXB33_07330 [Clostridia bacterium]|nr:hypothetical protein [Clostridia bacterium]
MGYVITKDFPDGLLYEEKGPFVSLYQPAHRYSPGNRQDPIVFRNLLGGISGALEGKYPKEDIAAVLAPLEEIRNDTFFWKDSLDGLAVLANPGRCIVYRLRMPVSEHFTAGGSLYIKPLIRYFSSTDEFFILGIGRDRFSLFEGNKHGIDEVGLPAGQPSTLEEVLGSETGESYLSYAFYGGAGARPMYHGHNDRKAEEEKDTEKFFRYIDRFVFENYSKDAAAPLILAGLPEHISEFRKISKNPHLADEEIRESLAVLDKERLEKTVKGIAEGMYVEKAKKLADSFHVLAGKDLASDNIERIASFIIENRTGTVMIEAERSIPGWVDMKSGDVHYNADAGPGSGDVLDDLAEMVIKLNGNVLILPSENMPSKTGIAAIFRY